MVAGGFYAFQLSKLVSKILHSFLGNRISYCFNGRGERIRTSGPCLPKADLSDPDHHIERAAYHSYPPISRLNASVHGKLCHIERVGHHI